MSPGAISGLWSLGPPRARNESLGNLWSLVSGPVRPGHSLPGTPRDSSLGPWRAPPGALQISGPLERPETRDQRLPQDTSLGP